MRDLEWGGGMRDLEWRAESVADTFNAQNMANTLWACTPAEPAQASLLGSATI
jgi:hypothetical protein